MDREWIKYINTSLIGIFPIQFANCDRLQKNDAVYIFDEVGSGKTISSGLMTLDYLSNHPDKNVLVVTTNALCKKSIFLEYGQFLKDWYDKLPFIQLGLKDKIEIVNNHYSNLKPESYGLVIVDEAQLFLNQDSLRYQNLSKVKADKIVFLTATPIKTSKNDLYIYVELAESILGKKLRSDWIDEINTCKKAPQDIICSKFDETYPVTRYFKDTIMSLSVDGFQKRQARRLTPELWEYNRNSSKDDILIQQISEKHNKDNRNRFVVFTRFVEKEARAIGELLKESGFSEYNGMTTDSEKTFKVITGNNGYELSEYSRISNLPTVLILTYQIAEQGVNLPGYNHVVNYHISVFPSALEQRFGRIDRMGKNGSQYPKINMCFLISKDYCWDTNTFNFYCAVNTYLHNLISYLPSKNTILSTKIIRKYSETRDYVKKYIKHILQLLDTSEQMNFIYDYFCHMADDKVEDKSSIECMCDKELFQLIDENGIDIDITLDKDNAIKKLRGEIKDLLAEFGKEIGNNENYSVEKYENLFKQILDNDSEAVSDKIFYSDDENYVNIKTIDAIEECAQIIAEPESKFDVFREKFNDEVRLPNIVTKYLVRINKYFEQKFINNDFNSLFPYGGYSNIFKDILLDLPDGEDKALLVNNSDVIVKILPIFKMFSMYGDILKKLVYTQNNGIMEKFYFNQFNTAFYGLLKKVRMDIGHFGLSNEFCERYFTNDDWWRPDLYTIIPPRNSEDTAQASNWYKLAYHYTRKEEACFIKKSEYYWDDWDYCTDSDNNLYRRKEELKKYLATNFEKYKSAYALWNEEWEQYNSAYKTAMDGENSDFDPHELLKEMGFCGEPEKAEIIDEYENAERELEEVLKRIDAESSLHQSVFNYFIFTDADNYRTHSMKINASVNWKVRSSDWWTQGILNEVYGWNYKKVK